MTTEVIKVFNSAGGTGVDFTTTPDVVNYINGLDLLSLDQDVRIQIIGDFPLPSYVSFGPSTADDTHRVTFCPAPGQNVNQLDTAVFNEGADGARFMLIHGRAQNAKPGVVFEDLRIYVYLGASGAGLVCTGKNTSLSKWDVEFHRCRFIDVGSVATQTVIVGNSGNRTLIDDCLAVIDGAQHIAFSAQSPCMITNTTFVARNAGLNAPTACNDSGDSLLFIGFGNTASGGATVTNSYANTAQSSGGVTYVPGTNALVVDESNDFRPKLGSPIIGAGGTTEQGTLDILGNSRGAAPDVGAYQHIPVPASAVVITGNNSVTTGYTTSLRIATDSPLTGAQSVVVTPSDGAGGSFTPASVTLDANTGFAFVTYAPTATIGSRTVTASATGTPALTPATFAFSVTAPVPASALTLAGASTSVVGTAVTLTVGTDQPLQAGQSETVSFSDGAGGIFAPATVTLNHSTQTATVQYTPAASGAHTVTASATGTPTLTNGTLANTAAPAPPSFVTGTNIYEVGAGKQFADLSAFATFIGGKDLVAQQANVVAWVYTSAVVSGLTIKPGTSNAQYNMTIMAAPAASYLALASNGLYDYPDAGVELTINGLTLCRGATLQGFRLSFPNASMLVFDYLPDSTPESVSFLLNNRILVTNPASSGHSIQCGTYSSALAANNNVMIRTAGSGYVINFIDGSGDFIGNTCIARGTATGNCGVKWQSYGGDGLIQDNVFIDCGDMPISTDGGGFTPAKYNNNFSNTALSSSANAKVAPGLTINTTAAFVQNKASDLRPANPGPLFGTGNALVASTLDAAGANRGTHPDAGAFQLIPAIPVPGGTITSINVSGQTVTISGTTTNTPSSGQASIAPTADAYNNAVGQGPVAVTLGSGTFSAAFSTVHSGKYAATITLTNAGGTGSVGGTSTFEVSGTAGVITSQVLDGQQLTIMGTTSGTPTGATLTIPPDATTPNGASQIGPLALTLGSGTFSDVITVQPGNYAAPQIVFDSAYGKSFPASGASAFAVVGISGNPDGTAGSGSSSGGGGSTTDTTAPVMTGTISTSAVTASGFTMAWPAGSDNVGIALYEYSTDGGTSYASNGTSLSVVVTGKTAATTYALRARAKDAAGNVSNVLAGSVTTSSTSGGGSGGGGGSTVRSITLSLVNLTQAPAANLAGLKWAWFDQATPNLFTAPTDKGNLESTDANGAITISLPNSALSVGQTGWLIVTDSDGNPATLHDAFSGPVTVA